MDSRIMNVNTIAQSTLLTLMTYELTQMSYNEANTYNTDDIQARIGFHRKTCLNGIHFNFGSMVTTCRQQLSNIILLPPVFVCQRINDRINVQNSKVSGLQLPVIMSLFNI